MPRLVLIRHAKSSWDDARASDHERVLNDRGRAAAPLIGDWLAGRGVVPDQVLCSDAARTRETWDLIAARIDGPPPTLIPALYHATPGTMLQVLRQAEGEVVAMVGHNPGIGGFARSMVAAPPDHPRFADYPTAATTVMEFGGAWRDAAPGTGRVAGFVVPRDLEE